VELKLVREGETGFAPVITLAWWNVAASILDCCMDTRPLPNRLLCMELIPPRTRSSDAARSILEIDRGPSLRGFMPPKLLWIL
jgi:hypothetical protein